MNVLDWSVNDNLAVALGNCLYLWNYHTSDLKKLKTFSSTNLPTSLSFDMYSETLVVGSKSGQVEVIDVATNKEIRTINAHNQRIGALSLVNNQLLTGSRDFSIRFFDIRCYQYT